MWTDSKISLAMGLQSTLATKRKHDFATNNKTNDFYTNCSPSKTTKWSNDKNLMNNNSNHIVSPHNNNNNNSITTKIDIVAAGTVNENWNQEPVDCISKLQAVTVPSDTWGNISSTTRSTLATTLLSTSLSSSSSVAVSGDLDDDEDDFEDDYDDEESVIPTYCSVRYSCPPQPQQRIYQSHSNGYITKPNFYTEPFPQQNCSRTINQHFRMNGLNWNNNNNNSNNNNNNNNNSNLLSNKNNNSNNNNKNNSKNNSNQQNNNYYITSESLYSQQTIRCAENGKSYLELGSSNLNTTNLNARHIKKCGCDGRGTWCNSKNCYKDIRLKIRNLSMFKLSKFRQVSEQSLYRSVLICNTLKQIDKEIEIESKDVQQQQQQQQQHHHQHQQQQQHIPNGNITTNNNNNNNEYSPIRCTRVCNLNRGNNNINNNLGNIQHRNHHLSNINNNDDSNNRECFQSFLQFNNSNNNSSKINLSDNFNFNNNNNQLCTNDLLHPYDHYPFREPQSGRATPFPASITNNNNNTSTIPLNETDSGYGGDDDNNRTINWSSVLSLSSQSALDPLNNNDLFSILPTTTATISSSSSSSLCTSQSSITSNSLNCNSFTSSSITSNNSISNINNNNSTCNNSSIFTSSQLSTTQTTLTTSSSLSTSLSTIENNNNNNTSSCSSWEYGFLDMDLGLGTEFTELVPGGCKITSEELFKTITPNTSRYNVHENEMESPAHIMVGS